MHALAQAFVTGPATKRFGEKQAIIAGMAADALGYVLLAFATRGWMAFPIMSNSTTNAYLIYFSTPRYVGEHHPHSTSFTFLHKGTLVSIIL
ncbi:hypothetical protein ACLD4N_23370, partial [Cronobacter sakazakii]